MIDIKRLRFSFKKGKPVFSDLYLNIQKGEFVVITGDSGSGKTTLLRLIQNELQPESGEVTVAGYLINKLKTKEKIILRRKTGAIYQDFKLVQSMTAYENVALALKIRGINNNIVKGDTLRILTELGMSHALHFYPEELSGGEKQKVAIARAIIGKPLLLLADEPAGALDEGASREIFNILKRINIGGTTVLLATHEYKPFLKEAYKVKKIVNGKLQNVDGNGSKGQ